jgi:hypothetical protein
MSIPRDVLLAQVAAGVLVPLAPLSRRAQIRRALFVTAEIWERLNGATRDEIDQARYGSLRADLEVFVGASEIYPNYLFWLTKRSDLVWEIRSVADIPSIRVLGRFAAQDVFVALTIEERSELEGWNSEQWRRAIRTTIQRWRAIFPAYQPCQGSKADDFFTGAIPDRYFKK